MSNTKIKIIIILFILSLLTFFYNVFDNNRISIVRQKIKIEGLPDPLQGFNILQISDLHGKSFGDKQKNLLEKINTTKYDMIAITGDAINQNQDWNSIFDMLDGIKNKDNIFFVNGNSVEGYDFLTGEKTSFGKEIEKRGVKLLTKPYSINRNGEILWITEFQNNMRNENILQSVRQEMKISKDEQKVNKLKFQEKYLLDQKLFKEMMKPKDIKIALTHYPATQNFLEKPEIFQIPDYDLILAGHYHGGQMRIPFYGAVYIPEGAGYKYFPPDEKVSGLNKWGKYQQYISRGLGATDSVKILSFRLFNTPEINLITLVKDN